VSISQLTACKHPPLKSGQIGFLVQKDEQCSESYKKQLSNFYFLRNGRFCTKLLENLPKYMTIFFCCPTMLWNLCKTIFRIKWLFLVIYFGQFSKNFEYKIDHLSITSANFAHSIFEGKRTFSALLITFQKEFISVHALPFSRQFLSLNGPKSREIPFCFVFC